jgi:hypothetical protein
MYRQVYFDLWSILFEEERVKIKCKFLHKNFWFIVCSLQRRADPSSRGTLPSVSLSVMRFNNNPLQLQWLGRRGQIKKEWKDFTTCKITIVTRQITKLLKMLSLCFHRAFLFGGGGHLIRSFSPRTTGVLPLNFHRSCHMCCNYSISLNSVPYTREATYLMKTNRVDQNSQFITPTKCTLIFTYKCYT